MLKDKAFYSHKLWPTFEADICFITLLLIKYFNLFCVLFCFSVFFFFFKLQGRMALFKFYWVLIFERCCVVFFFVGKNTKQYLSFSATLDITEILFIAESHGHLLSYFLFYTFATSTQFVHVDCIGILLNLKTHRVFCFIIGNDLNRP